MATSPIPLTSSIFPTPIPNAPKGGTLTLDALGSFDSFNPYIIKGDSASGLGLIYETLTTRSLDEPFSEYGLLAESIEMPEDRSWVAFTLRENARWHDGKPVTVDDVIWSLETLKEKGASLLPFLLPECGQSRSRWTSAGSR